MKDLNRCFERISATLSLAGICGVYVLRVKLRKANGRENSKKNARRSGAAGGDTRIAHAATAAYVDSFKAQCACSAVIKRRRSDAAATGSIFLLLDSLCVCLIKFSLSN